VRHGAAGNALDDHLGSAVTAEEDCDGSGRAEALYADDAALSVPAPR